MLSEHPTLNHFVDYIVKMTGGHSGCVNHSGGCISPKGEPEVVQQVSSEQEPVHTATSIGNSGDIQPKLIGVVVKHTGYPEDFIEMDQDLEGELGIDTVKQAEIMGDVREIFSLPVDEDFVLSDHPTLNHFVSYILRMKGGSESPQPQTQLVASETSNTDDIAKTSSTETVVTTTSQTRRWQVEVEPCPAVAEGLPIGGTIVLTQDSWGVADALASRLSAKGLSVAKVGFEFGAKSVTEQEELSGHTYRQILVAKSKLQKFVQELLVLAESYTLHHSLLTGSSWESEGASNQVNLAAQSWFRF